LARLGDEKRVFEYGEGRLDILATRIWGPQHRTLVSSSYPIFVGNPEITTRPLLNPRFSEPEPWTPFILRVIEVTTSILRDCTTESPPEIHRPRKTAAYL
jgi:hypothetical protein